MKQITNNFGRWEYILQNDYYANKTDNIIGFHFYAKLWSWNFSTLKSFTCLYVLVMSRTRTSPVAVTFTCVIRTTSKIISKCKYKKNLFNQNFKTSYARNSVFIGNWLQYIIWFSWKVWNYCVLLTSRFCSFLLIIVSCLLH